MKNFLQFFTSTKILSRQIQKNIFPQQKSIDGCQGEFPSFLTEGKDKKLLISNKILQTSPFYHNNAAHSDYQFKFS